MLTAMLLLYVLYRDFDFLGASDAAEAADAGRLSNEVMHFANLLCFKRLNTQCL
jgi:hypothetical protein